MPNDILKTDINITVKVDKSSTSSKTTDNQKEKGTTSLFDSILSKTKSKVSNDAKSTSDLKKTDIKSVISDKVGKQSTPVSTKKTINSKDISTEQTKNIEPSKLSLLDRMATDIKINSNTKNNKNEKVSVEIKKNINPEKDTTSKSKSLFDNLTTKKDVSKIEDITNKDISSKDIKTVSESKIIVKSEVDKEQLKPKSLFDNLTTTKDSNKIENIKSKDSNKIENIKSKDINQKDIKIIPENKIVLETKTNKIVEDKLPEDNTLGTKEIESQENKISNTLLETLISSVKEKNNSSINDSSNKDKKIDTTTKTSDKTSLLDKMIDSTKKTTSLTSSNKNDIGDESPLQAKIFLSNQKTQKDIISKQKIVEAKDILNSDDKSISKIKKSAEVLELKATKVEMVEEKEITKKQLESKTDIKEQLKQQNNMLNKIFLNQTKTNEGIALLKDIEVKNDKKVAEVKNTTEESKKINQDIKITVEQSVVQSINTKIIESKQKMDSFMSDVSKNMYLNYKPPITAFKIRLDPVNLGSIAIVMKNDKANNTISVSLNMSQNNTLEAFTDNKNSLQNSLNKVFNNDSTFSLNFGMQDGNSESFEQFNQQQNKNQSTDNSNIEIKEDKSSSVEEEIIDQSYM